MDQSSSIFDNVSSDNSHIKMVAKLYFILHYILFIFTQARANVELKKGQVVQIITSKQSNFDRDAYSIQFHLGGKKYHFDLALSNRQVFSNNAPIWLVKSKPGHLPNYTYELIEGNEEHLVNEYFYVDSTKKAVFFVHRDKMNNQFVYDGIFGESKNQYIVKSISKHQERLNNESKQGNHIVYRVNKLVREYTVHKRSINFYRSRNPLEIKLTKPLDNLYPKILVVVDNYLFRILDSNIVNTVRYVATFWNAADQKYAEVEYPKIQLLITGIIIANDVQALNYVYKNILKSDNLDYLKDKVIAQNLLKSVRMYFQRVFSSDVNFQNYDVVVLQTGLDTGNTFGLSMTGQVCSKSFNHAIVADRGDYSKVEIAIHELAHLLNVEHDQIVRCTVTEDGGRSIMTSINSDAEYLFWSECSKDTLREFVTFQASECLATRNRTRI